MPSPKPASESGPKRWIWLVGLLITGVLLWYSLRDVSLSEVWLHVRSARLAPLLGAVVLATATFPIRAIRWGVLLESEGTQPSRTALWHAVAIGFMANNILLARAGEVARAYVGAKLGGFRVTRSIGSIALERAMDGVVVVGLLAIPLLSSDLADATAGGRPIMPIVRLFGLLFAGVMLGALLLAWRPEFANRLVDGVARRVFSERLAGKITAIVDGLIEGLSTLRSGRRFAAAIFWSLVLWLVNAASFWVGLAAFGIETPLTAGLLVMGFVALGVAIPSSPGYFGVFEFATRAALVLYGITPTLAISFAVGYHITTFVPITLLGLWSLKHLHLTFAQVTHPDEEGAT